MIGKALCLPETVSARPPAAWCSTRPAPPGSSRRACSFPSTSTRWRPRGAILASVWTDADMPVIDCLGDEFLAAVQTGQTVRVLDGGIVEVA